MYKPLDIIACPAAFLFLFLNAFFRGCTCLKCTNQARAAPTKQELHQPSKSCTNQARAAPSKQELRQPSKSYINIPRLVHLRQVHPPESTS